MTKTVDHIKATQHRKKQQFSVPASEDLYVYVYLSTCVSNMVQGERKREIGFILGFYWQNIIP